MEIRLPAPRMPVSIRAPVKGATRRPGRLPAARAVSIRAPVKGATRGTTLIGAVLGPFQSAPT